MPGFLRFLATTLLGGLLSVEAATLICVPLGLGPNWWMAMCGGFGLVAGPVAPWIINTHIAAWKRLRGREVSLRRDGDGPTLLALFAMHKGPVRLFDVVLVLSPEPDAPSWLHPLRRWNVMIAWVRRNAELEAEARGLSDAGLLQRTERSRMWNDASLYEATGLGRDVAARNAEVLMASNQIEEG